LRLVGAAGVKGTAEEDSGFDAVKADGVAKADCGGKADSDDEDAEAEAATGGLGAMRWVGGRSSAVRGLTGVDSAGEAKAEGGGEGEVAKADLSAAGGGDGDWERKAEDGGCGCAERKADCGCWLPAVAAG
jgi:hypothetical protein